MIDTGVFIDKKNIDFEALKIFIWAIGNFCKRVRIQTKE